jgi:hypothetical protein
LEELTMELVPFTAAPTMPTVASAVEAEAALVEALARLDKLQLAALTGGRYDPDEYDAAIISYRHARAAAEDARAAWTQLQHATWHHVA